MIQDKKLSNPPSTRQTPFVYDEPILRQYLLDQPDATVKSMHKDLGVRYKSLYKALKKYGLITRFNRPFIPLSFHPREAFQFDWSEEEIELCGKITRIKVAHIRLCYSRYFLMIAYPNEQLEMVMDAHDEAFKFFGGSCHKGIYDNMKTAVQTILQVKNRKYNPRFLQMCSHHLFEPVACTPASGWEKGQVEGQVRSNFFTPLVKVSSFEELNLQLEAWCLSWAEKAFYPEQKTRTVSEIFQDERSSLTPYRQGLGRVWRKKSEVFETIYRAANEKYAQTARREELEDLLGGKIRDPHTGEVAYTPLVKILNAISGTALVSERNIRYCPRDRCHRVCSRIGW